MKEAYLEATRHYLEDDFYIDTYEWKGSKYGMVYVGVYAWSKGARKTMPWPVKVICTLDFDDTYGIVRKDVGWHLWWVLVKLWYVLFRSRRYFHFKWRVVKTFEIWGIGYTSEGEVTSWRNILRKRSK